MYRIDPLAEKFVYNSPYALQENKFGLGVELEGKEMLSFGEMQLLYQSAKVWWNTPLSEGDREAATDLAKNNFPGADIRVNTNGGAVMQVIAAFGSAMQDANGFHWSKDASLQVGKYGEMPKKAGFQNDHVPSAGALRTKASKELGIPLTAKQKKMINENGIAIQIPSEIHKNHSETYMYKNTNEKMTFDANNLKDAINNNLNAYKKQLENYGYSNYQINKAFNKLKKLNRENGTIN